MKTLKDFNFNQKKAIIRVDFNVPLDENFKAIINVHYTAEMEAELDRIAEGEENNVEAIQRFIDKFYPLLEKANETMEKIPDELVGEKCPECGHDLVYRNGRFGRFIACSNFPECRYLRPLEENKKPAPEPTGEMCPECGKPLVKRMSRYKTEFVACSGFPKCRYIQPNDNFKKKKQEALEGEDEVVEVSDEASAS